MFGYTKKGLLCLLALILCALPVAAQVKNKGKEPQQVVREKLPVVIDIDEQVVNGGLVLTLAVEAVTTFRCPEPVLQVLYGNQKAEEGGIILEEPLSGRPDIYIRPMQGNLYTDMTIVMPSGDFRLYVQTVNILRPGVGDYHNVVVVKSEKYNNDLVELRKRLEESTNELAGLKKTIDELEKKAIKEVVDNGDEDKLSFLRLIETTSLSSSSSRQQTSAGNNGKVRIRQLSKGRTKNGWVVVFAVENRGKEQLTLDELRTVDSSKLTTTLDGTRKLSPGAEIRIAVLIEAQPQLASREVRSAIVADAGAPNLVFVIGGVSNIVKVQ